jgi:hypothetical protein
MALGDAIGVISVLPYDVGSKPRRPAGADCVNAVALAAATAESITVPATASIVRLVATLDSYVKFTGTATVPVDTVDGTASELMPAGKEQWYYIKGLTISVISAGTPIVTASFYL